MLIDVQCATTDDKLVIRNLLALYLYEFSAFDGRDVNEYGLFSYRYLDHYWTELDRHPFLVRVDGRLAEFGLVRAEILTERQFASSIAEFFVMRKYPRQGVGQNGACRIFDLFPGRWEVAHTRRNLTAQAFWRSVIARYTEGAVAETIQDDPKRSVYQFGSPPGRTD